MSAYPNALIFDREAPVGCCGRQDQCCSGMRDQRKSTTDGPSKPTHKEIAPPNRRPLLTRAQSKHLVWPLFLIRPRSYSPRTFGAESARPLRSFNELRCFSHRPWLAHNHVFVL